MGGVGMGSMGVIWPLLVVTGLLVGGYLCYRLLSTRGAGGASDANIGAARRILDERYARGEIDEAEYRRRRSELES